MMVSCFAIANASTTFNDKIPCKTTSDTPHYLAEWPTTQDHQGGIYIYHNVTTKVKTKHNNLFYAEGSADYQSEYFSKWLTPGVNRFCKSSLISYPDTIHVKARGNTKYYEDNSSITKINVKGSIGWKK